MAEQGVAPAAGVSQTPPRIASGNRPTQYEVCLQWLDAVWMKGGESRPDHVRVMPSGPDSEVRSRGSTNATSGAPEGERADRKARGAFARCQLLTRRLSALRSLTL